MLRRAGYSTMAILRMLIQLDRGKTDDLRQVLDTPSPEEDVYSAADQWLSALTAQDQRAMDVIAQLEDMIDKRPNRRSLSAICPRRSTSWARSTPFGLQT